MADPSFIHSRFKIFEGTTEYKSELHSSLFEVMKTSDYYQLRRNKVLIKNTSNITKDKFVILEVYRRKSGDLYYCCPLCSDKIIADSISENCSPDILPSCIHSDVCSQSHTMG